MNLLFFQSFISVLLPALFLQATAEHCLEHHNLLPRFSHPIAAWGLVAFAGYAAFWAYFAAPWLGWIFIGALHIGAILYWIRYCNDIPKNLIGIADSHLCRILMVVIGIGYLGLLHLWRSDQPLETLVANRFSHPLPADNIIPRIIADRLATGQSPKGVLGDWLSSDRPPLQTGFILLLRLPLRSMGDPDTRAVAAAMLFQLLWIPGLWALLRGAGARQTETLSAIGLVACTGFCLLHSVYTWPKLSAAGLVMGGASLMLNRSTGSRMASWIIGSSLCALGYLTHGGVMFSLLALAPLTLLTRPNKTMLATAAGIFLLITLPWNCYQKFYDPPGNRLLKWHIAGVIPIDSRGTWETLRASYHEISWNEILQNKQANVAVLFQDGPWRLFDLSPTHVSTNRAAEFFHFFRALGLGSWLLLLLPCLAWRLHRDKASISLMRSSALQVGWAALTLIGWILLMFGPGTTVIHQGSLAPLLVLWTLPVIVLARWWRGSLVFVAILQLTLLFAVWVPASSHPHGALSASALTLTLCSAVLMGFLAVFIHKNQAVEKCAV